MTTPRGRHPAATATVPRSELPQVRLVLGAAAAAVGLFAALHWIVLPGDHLWLDQKNRRTESVAALDSTTHAGSGRNAAADRAGGVARPARHDLAAVAKARKGQAAKTAPRTAGKPIGTSPGTTRPGAPGAGDPPASGSNSPASTAPAAAPSAHWSTPAPAAASGSRGSSGSRPECPGRAEAAGTERPDPTAADAPVKRAFKSSASFSLPLPHTYADTRIEEARVGKSVVPASANRGTPSTRREMSAA